MVTVKDGFLRLHGYGTQGEDENTAQRNYYHGLLTMLVAFQQVLEAQELEDKIGDGKQGD